MEWGKIDLGGTKAAGCVDDEDFTEAIFRELPRLLLFGLIILAFIIGVVYSRHRNAPDRVVARSIEYSLGQPFLASIEGSVAVQNSFVFPYRSRQEYAPESGVSVVDERGADRGDLPIAVPIPCDAMEALQMLRGVTGIEEYDPEDMYGHATRHFGGGVPMTGSSDGESARFDYWVDMRDFRAVKLVLKDLHQNVPGVSGEPVPQTVYLSIRYHGWR